MLIMLGVVMQRLPDIRTIKEVCLRSRLDFKIATVILDDLVSHRDDPYPWFDTWLQQLRAAGCGTDP